MVTSPPTNQVYRPWACLGLTPDTVAAIAERVRVPRWFARSGLIEPDDVREMLAYQNSGLSIVPKRGSLQGLSRPGAVGALLCPSGVRA